MIRLAHDGALDGEWVVSLIREVLPRDMRVHFDVYMEWSAVSAPCSGAASRGEMVNV